MVPLTVVVPVYNVEKYLPKCIESILAQDYPELDVLLIDDGSSDNSGRICDEYVARDKRIRVIHQENKGVGITRNIGIREAKGEYISFVDSDDFILPGMYKEMGRCFEEKSDIIICDYYTFNNDNDTELELHAQNISAEWSSEYIIDQYLLDKYPSYMCNKIFKKELFQNLLIPSRTVFEDLYISAELFTRSKKIVYVPQGYYCYRKHVSAITSLPKVTRKAGYFMAWREHERVCEEHGLEPLLYCRYRAQQAAISLKTISIAQPYLTEEQEEILDEYLKDMKDKMTDLPIKQRFIYWVYNNLPLVCKVFGMMSVMLDNMKRKKFF